jgi:hypothetical protein
MREKTMKKVGVIRSLVAAAVIAAYCGVAAAQVAEVEDNSQISSTQALTVDANGTVTVSAAFTTGDVDFYSFQGKKDDEPRININGGVQSGLDLFVTFLGPNEFGSQQALGGNDDCNPDDWDPCLPQDGVVVPLKLAQDGLYYVAVTHSPAQVLDNGVVLGRIASLPPAPGSYTLTISGVTPAQAPQDPPPSQEPPAPPSSDPKNVRIDIRPGERAEKATVHLARARIPVAILSSEDFDAMQVDPSTLTFGRTGDEHSLEKCFSQGIRVNRDRRRDLVCLFSIKAAEFEPNDVEGILKGSTTGGTQIQGRALLKVIEIHKGKRHRGQSHDHDRRGGRDRDDNDHKKHRR